MSGEWAEQAKCKGVDTELFFAPPEEGGIAKEVSAAARAFCRGEDDSGKECPVRRECLEYAIEANEKFGVWGGLDEGERRRVRRDRRAAERAREAARAAVVVRRRVVIRREVRWK